MRRILTIALALFPVLCWGQPDTLWTKLINTPYRDEARAVVETSDGGFMVAGLYATGGGVPSSIRLVRFNPSGDTLYTRIVADSSIGLGWVEAMISDGVGGFYVACGNGNHLIRLNAQGDTLWTRVVSTSTPYFNGPYFYGPRCIGLTSDGGCFLGEYMWILGSSGGWYYYPRFEKRDSLGNQAWLHNTAADRGIQRLVDGRYFCLSTSVTVTMTDDQGDVLWVRQHSMQVQDDPEGMDIVATSDGGYAFICEFTGDSSLNVRLVRVNSSGAVVWTRDYEHFLGGVASRCLFSESDGGYIITGSRYYDSGGTNSDFYVVRTNSVGDTLWTRAWGTSDEDFLWNTIHTSDGGLVLVGFSRPSDIGDESMYVVRTGPVLDADALPAEIPNSLSLSNFPNPFNSSTEIAFDLPKAGKVSLKVFDLLGREVAVVQEGMMTAGSHRVRFDGKGLASGVYVYCLKAADGLRAKKMVLLK